MTPDGRFLRPGFCLDLLLLVLHAALISVSLAAFSSVHFYDFVSLPRPSGAAVDSGQGRG